LSNLKMELEYVWQPAYLREKVEYLFPLDISPYMRNRYKGPAVFRWEVFQKEPGDKKLVYVGEAQELCPKRLYGYLNPGPTQQSNRKVNTDFRNYLKEKLNIRLDVLDLRELNIPGLTAGPNSLQDKYIRRLLVNALILEHRQQGYNVIDL
jgi:hypothetical protein